MRKQAKQSKRAARLNAQVAKLPRAPAERRIVDQAERAAVRAIKRARWVFEAENLIAEMREPAEIDKVLMEKFKLTRTQAGAIRVSAWRAILSAGESTRRDRFREMQRTIRRLYVAAFDRQDFAVCSSLTKQLREMYDLVRPFAEGGAAPTVDDGRTTEELEFFAMHGHYPEDEPKAQQLAEQSGNPLDELS